MMKYAFRIKEAHTVASRWEVLPNTFSEYIIRQGIKIPKRGDLPQGGVYAVGTIDNWPKFKAKVGTRTGFMSIRHGGILVIGQFGWYP